MKPEESSGKQGRSCTPFRMLRLPSSRCDWTATLGRARTGPISLPYIRLYLPISLTCWCSLLALVFSSSSEFLLILSFSFLLHTTAKSLFYCIYPRSDVTRIVSLGLLGLFVYAFSYLLPGFACIHDNHFPATPRGLARLVPQHFRYI